MNQPQRVAIVTGGAGGVGAATALMLAQRGYHVAITYQRNRQNADAVVQACQAHGVQALAMAVNVAEDADCQALAHAAHERWGRIDALANCAGTTTFVPLTDMDAVSAQDFQDIYAVNAIGPFQMSRAAAKHMVDGAAIVNVSSLAQLDPFPGFFAYASSKSALHLLTVVADAEGEPQGVRAFTVAPGVVDTPLHRTLMPESMPPVDGLTSVLYPDDIARVIVEIAEGRHDRRAGRVLAMPAPAAVASLRQWVLDHPGGGVEIVC